MLDKVKSMRKYSNFVLCFQYLCGGGKKKKKTVKEKMRRKENSPDTDMNMEKREAS
jgi:hypothetical protein